MDSSAIKNPTVSELTWLFEHDYPINSSVWWNCEYADNVESLTYLYKINMIPIFDIESEVEFKWLNTDNVEVLKLMVNNGWNPTYSIHQLLEFGVGTKILEYLHSIDIPFPTNSAKIASANNVNPAIATWVKNNL